jgi:methionine synthase I (cobalamin-dependent)/5,10-methylenetetrahydrofolate reductase
MTNETILQRLTMGPLLSDGAMGTMLHARGVNFEQCFDELNLTDPDLIADIHMAYVLAGADIIQTNTFGANRFKLARHGLEDQVARINKAGVELVRRGISGSLSERPILVAGDIGPLGVRIAPYGRVQPEQARQAFVEQINALADAGVDLLMIETISDLYEIVASIQAAIEVRTQRNIQLPICASMTFTRDDRTELGDNPAKVARSLAEAGADVIGVNCSGGPAQLMRRLKAMRQAVPQVPISVQPNAGWPEQAGGRIMYPADPEYFGNYAMAFCEAGASIVGGCCGTTPQHIQAMRLALDENPQGCGSLENVLALPDEAGDLPEAQMETSRLSQKLASGKFCIAVEMDPPRGISTHKLVAGASLLAEAGADVINVDDSPMARMRMSAWAVCDVVQRQVGVDSTLHFPTRGRNLLRVQGDLLAAHALGIRNVFVVMGDPTSIGDYPEAMDNYDLVPSGLIKLIKQGFNTGLDHSGTSIGQPTAFFVGSALNLKPSDPEKEIKNLHRKVRSGADFFLTQPIYRPEDGPAFLEKYEQAHGKLNKPILAGILPLVSHKHATFLNNEVPGISIPVEILTRLEQAGDQAARVGVETTIELVRQIKTWAQGIYIMPQFHRYDLVAEIIEAVKED